jgi:amidohydrolase
MRAEILAELKAYEPELIEIRRDIHRHPELGFEETRTAALVAERLKAWGIETHEGVGRTGVVGTIRGHRGGNRAIGLRADMDALPIQEVEGRAHGSAFPGKMHACGHDGHTTMLLGAARYLAENRDFAGAVHVIFQPAEEGRGGGRAMIEDGLFERFPMETVHGMHNFPGLPIGMFATNAGPMLASVGVFTASFLGNAGHGGLAPHEAVDTTLAASQYVTQIQSIVSRNVKASETAVISVGHIAGGDYDAPNVIPAKVTVRGTTRCFAPSVREIFERRLREFAENAASAFGCKLAYDYHWVTPTLVSTPEETKVAVGAARALVGERAVIPNMPPVTGGEDFAYMLEVKPGSFMGIGNGVGPDGAPRHLHTPDYDFDDANLVLGAGYWVSLVQEALGG